MHFTRRNEGEARERTKEAARRRKRSARLDLHCELHNSKAELAPCSPSLIPARVGHGGRPAVQAG
jgi:hypothetical protein